MVEWWWDKGFGDWLIRGDLVGTDNGEMVREVEAGLECSGVVLC